MGRTGRVITTFGDLSPRDPAQIQNSSTTSGESAETSTSDAIRDSQKATQEIIDRAANNTRNFDELNDRIKKIEENTRSPIYHLICEIASILKRYFCLSIYSLHIPHISQKFEVRPHPPRIESSITKVALSVLFSIGIYFIFKNL